MRAVCALLKLLKWPHLGCLGVLLLNWSRQATLDVGDVKVIAISSALKLYYTKFQEFVLMAVRALFSFAFPILYLFHELKSRSFRNLCAKQCSFCFTHCMNSIVEALCLFRISL